jgi:hypothetical protein
MPADPADIGPAIREARIESWESATIHTRYPNARDGSTDPAEGFYDAASDADTAIAARATLIGTERRRFGVPVQDMVWPSPTSGLLNVTLVDPDQSVSAGGISTRIELDLDGENMQLEVLV